MKKIINGIFLLMMTSMFAMAQENDQTARDKIEAARIAYITEQLELTPEQAEKFWPLYREYLDQRASLRKEYMETRRGMQKEELSEEESKRLVDMGLKFKERETELQRTYSERLVTVITNRQLLQLRKSEEDFRRMLLQRLDRRREAQERMQQRRKEIDN